MSVYNFNDSEHGTVINHETCLPNGNGMQPSGYQQIENDFLNRNLNQTSNHGESSVKLTRPTSKTALLVRQRRAMLEQLSCSICKGYLIDATTIDECMDSFCKSCIVVYLTRNNDCPKCGVIIQHQNPFDAIRPDKVLQEIVYKMIPGLFDDEMRRRRNFYKGHYGAISSPSSDDSSTGSLTIQGSSLTGERYGVVPHPKPFYKPSDSIDLSIEPQTRGDSTTIYYDNRRQSIVTCFTGSLQRDLHDDGSTFSSVDSQLFKTYLRCPARLTVLQLKKFIAAKFNICRDDTIHLKYLNESLKDEYSLIDVAYIYDWRGLEHMQLFYIIERDLSKLTIANGKQPDSHRGAGKSTRQSVGTSTQTIKRVCIDPQPKFYQEKNNNNIDLLNTVGRSMRPRIDNPSSVNKTTQVTQTNPIIKTSRNNNERLSSSVELDGARGQAFRQNRIFSARQQPTQGIVSKPAGVPVKESRSLRSQVTGATRTLSSVSTEKKDVITASRIKVADEVTNNNVSRNIERNIATIPQNKTVSQIVPYTGARFTTMASATQSSLVTMESFVESRSNHVVTTVSSNANTPAVYANRSPSNSVNKNGQGPKYNSTPQLAFSFVTERGITIVRRINNQDDATSSPGTIVGNNATARPISLSGSSSIQHNSFSPTRHPVHHDDARPSSSRTFVDDGMSSRHQIKVKPVYKTLVDPTKLKSPNLKKLGFTARH